MGLKKILEKINTFKDSKDSNFSYEHFEINKVDNVEELFNYLINFDNKITKSEIVKIIYLLDWKYCLINNVQLTNIDWEYDNKGPYSKIFDEIILSYEINKDNTFVIKKDINLELSENTKVVIEFILEKLSRLGYINFTNLVFSTYPMFVTEKYSKLNLEKLSNEYKEIHKNK